MNKVLYNKEETTHRKAKERKKKLWITKYWQVVWKSESEKQHTKYVIVCGSKTISSYWDWKLNLPPQSKPDGCYNRLGNLAVRQYLYHPQALAPLWGYNRTEISPMQQVSREQNTSFLKPQRSLARCQFEREPPDQVWSNLKLECPDNKEQSLFRAFWDIWRQL
jgi:hypothetical protein